MRMIVTATETIQGATIERYIDTICANVVLGSNVFADFGASFTDFFGGRSGIYEGKLALIYEKAKKSLKQKAQMIGANAIVGFKIDFDEISAQGKSMFMVAASGTACKVIYEEKELSAGSVSGIKLKEREAIDKAVIDLKKLGVGVSNNPQRAAAWTNWDLLEIIEEPTIPFAELLTSVYHEIQLEGAQAKIESCLSKLDYDVLCDIIYTKYEDDSYLYYLIKELRLFNSSKVLDLVKRWKLSLAIRLFTVDKEAYIIDDLNNMKEMLHIIDNLPDLWKKEVVKGGFMSKDKEMYICPCGQKNDLDSNFCKGCNKDIKGLTLIEKEFVDTFRFRVNTLSDLFNK